MKIKLDERYFTPGRFTAMWYLLVTVKRYETAGARMEAVTGLLRSSGILGGALPAADGIHLAQSCGLVEMANENVRLTEHCRTEIMPLCTSDYPNVDVVRALVFYVMKNNPFHWIVFFDEDFDAFKTAIPSNWIDLLAMARLLDVDDPDVSKWWKELLEKYQDYDENRNKKIGDVGEKLTIEHEMERLLLDGLSRPYSVVKWVSRFNDSSGYDIQSVRGELLRTLYEPADAIRIEVKSSAAATETNFRFFLTKNEWNTALSSIEAYYFYCWIGVDIEKSSAIKGPFIIPAKQLEDHVPNDRSDICEWTQCRLQLNLSEHSLRQTI